MKNGRMWEFENERMKRFTIYDWEMIDWKNEGMTT